MFKYILIKNKKMTIDDKCDGQNKSSESVLEKQPNEPYIIPLSNGEPRYNAGIKCDVEKGPCSCGAWHEYKQ